MGLRVQLLKFLFDEFRDFRLRLSCLELGHDLLCGTARTLRDLLPQPLPCLLHDLFVSGISRIPSPPFRARLIE
jgi:hypothetical protein